MDSYLSLCNEMNTHWHLLTSPSFFSSHYAYNTDGMFARHDAWSQSQSTHADADAWVSETVLPWTNAHAYAQLSAPDGELWRRTDGDGRLSKETIGSYFANVIIIFKCIHTSTHKSSTSKCIHPVDVLTYVSHNTLFVVFFFLLSSRHVLFLSLVGNMCFFLLSTFCRSPSLLLSAQRMPFSSHLTIEHTHKHTQHTDKISKHTHATHTQCNQTNAKPALNACSHESVMHTGMSLSPWLLPRRIQQLENKERGKECEYDSMYCSEMLYTILILSSCPVSLK